MSDSMIRTLKGGGIVVLAALAIALAIFGWKLFDYAFRGEERKEKYIKRWVIALKDVNALADVEDLSGLPKTLHKDALVQRVFEDGWIIASTTEMSDDLGFGVVVLRDSTGRTFVSTSELGMLSGSMVLDDMVQSIEASSLGVFLSAAKRRLYLVPYKEVEGRR